MSPEEKYQFTAVQIHSLPQMNSLKWEKNGEDFSDLKMEKQTNKKNSCFMKQASGN